MTSLAPDQEREVNDLAEQQLREHYPRLHAAILALRERGWQSEQIEREVAARIAPVPMPATERDRLMALVRSALAHLESHEVQ